jgi:hypothetical protein
MQKSGAWRNNLQPTRLSLQESNRRVKKELLMIRPMAFAKKGFW